MFAAETCGTCRGALKMARYSKRTAATVQQNQARCTTTTGSLRPNVNGIMPLFANVRSFASMLIVSKAFQQLFSLAMRSWSEF